MPRMIRNLVLAFVILQFGVVTADDWPQFLGMNRNGISKEKGLIDSWPKDGLKIDWKIDLGEGMSGIAVVGDRVLTMYQDDKSQFVTCRKVSNGEKIWETAVSPRYENSMGHGPRATPTVHGNLVFTYTGEGILDCLNLETGKVIWTQYPHGQTKPKHAEYGMASSPLVIGDQVIVNATPYRNEGRTLMSFSTSDGKFKWTSFNIHPGYSSPMIFKAGEKKQVVSFGGTELFGVDPKSGKVVWTFPFKTEYNCNTATPIQIGKDLLISSGENHGSILLAIDAKTMKAKPKWSSLGKESCLRSEWQTPIHVDGHLYGMDNVGSAGPITNLTCVDAKTGKQKWIKKRFGKGNLIFADGKLLISTMKGELIVAKAQPDSYVEIGRQKVVGQTRQAPALSNGKVFLRDNRELICIDLSKK